MSDFDDTPPAESAAEAAEAFLAADAVPAASPAAAVANTVASTVTSRKGLLIGAGALIGALAAAAVVFEQRRCRQDDPWAVPLSDPYGDSSDSSPGDEAAGDQASAGDEAATSSNTPVFDAATTDTALVGDAGVNDPAGDLGDLGGLADVPVEGDEQH